MTLRSRTSPRRAPLRAKSRAELERDAVVAAVAAVDAEARAQRPATTRERTECEGYNRALQDLSREIRERLEALDKEDSR